MTWTFSLHNLSSTLRSSNSSNTSKLTCLSELLDPINLYGSSNLSGLLSQPNTFNPTNMTKPSSQ